MSQQDVERYLYQPSRAARVTLTEIERIHKQPYRLTWGIPSVDSYVTPMLGGDLVTVLGRPGMGKTTVLLHLARQAVQQLASVGDPGIVLYATWETLVEETVALFSSAAGKGIELSTIGRGEADLQEVERAVMSLVGEHLGIFGRSKTTTRQNGKSQSTRVHNLEDLETALVYLRAQDKPVRLLLVDYLQRIPGLPGQDRQGRASENLERVKDIALVQDVPVAMAVQSRRDVDDYSGLKMPNLSDGQWSSNVEQSSDKMLGVTRPWVYAPAGQPIKSQDAGYEWQIHPETLVLKVIKQRWAPAGDIFVLTIDFAGLTLNEQPPESMPF